MLSDKLSEEIERTGMHSMGLNSINSTKVAARIDQVKQNKNQDSFKNQSGSKFRPRIHGTRVPGTTGPDHSEILENLLVLFERGFGSWTPDLDLLCQMNSR